MDSLLDSLAEDFEASDLLDDEPDPLVAGAVCENFRDRGCDVTFVTWRSSRA